ncbi:MAG: hypothetical protein VB106_05605 [Clostridiaceae bacterium]|nr:hypothetical protein [Clostridiaceae bacterium]
MLKFDIVELMCTGFEGYEDDINGKIKAKEGYQEAQEIFYRHMERIHKNDSYKTMDEIEQSQIRMETVAKDTAFNEGFKMGVQMILGCLSERGVQYDK